MTAKQQIATGLLATLIICSVAFMPANADSNASSKASARGKAPVVAAKGNANQQQRDTPHELTYN